MVEQTNSSAAKGSPSPGELQAAAILQFMRSRFRKAEPKVFKQLEDYLLEPYIHKWMPGDLQNPRNATHRDTQARAIAGALYESRLQPHPSRQVMGEFTQDSAERRGDPTHKILQLARVLFSVPILEPDCSPTVASRALQQWKQSYLATERPSRTPPGGG